MRQLLINFCENRNTSAVCVEIRRSERSFKRYSSLKCRFANWQGGFWYRLTEWLEGE